MIAEAMRSLVRTEESRRGDMVDQASYEIGAVEVAAVCASNKIEEQREMTLYENRKKRGLGEVCRSCSSEIRPARRKALPHTTICVICAES